MRIAMQNVLYLLMASGMRMRSALNECFVLAAGV
jgi:hypothetical protein